MTANQHWLNQPHYNTAGCPDLMSMQANPRVSFNGVCTRVFPLKASMNRLQDFCDNYLNFPDDSLEMKESQTNFFRPSAPYVFFQMIDYGRMAIESQNLGWFAQNEVLFLVPLEWYKVDDNGQLYFHDWAMVCPFIFVDNDMSLTTGRETYGWSKVRCWLDWIPSEWAVNPQIPQPLLNMRTNVFHHVFAGERAEPRTLIEVTQQQAPTLGPGLLGQRNPFNPLWNIPERIMGGISASGNLFEVISNLPILGYRRRDLSSLTRMSIQGLKNMRAMLPWLPLSPPMAPARESEGESTPKTATPNLYYNQLTLKQFRHAAEPDYACYQALVNSKIAVEHYYDFGLLGGTNIAAGDLSGGFRLKIHEYPEQAIIDTFGLDIAERRMDAGNIPVAIVKPVMPFSMNCDLNYDTGETLAWRGKTSKKWNTGSDGPSPGGNAFNDTRGAAIQEVPGPFNHPNTTIRVLPLIAERQKLQKYCDDYLNDLDGPDAGANGNTFAPWGSYVYLVVTTYGNDDDSNKSWADTDNIGQFANSDVAFCFPVKWKETTEDGRTLRRLGVLTPYLFGSSSRQVISEREINGRPMVFAEIDSDDDSWLKTSGPLAARSFAKLKTLLIPALNAGQPAQMRELVEITDRQPLRFDDNVSWAEIRARWEPTLFEDDERKKNSIRRLEDSGSWSAIFDLFRNFWPHGRSLNFLSLKQYRGTERANRACYQALVLLRRKIKSIFWVAQMKPAVNHCLHVLIHRYPTVPIVETLGLKVKATDSAGISPVDYLEVKHPFFIRASVRDELGKTLFSRLNSVQWLSEESASAGTGRPARGADTDDGALIDEVDEPQAVIERLVEELVKLLPHPPPEDENDPWFTSQFRNRFGLDPEYGVWRWNRPAGGDEG